MAYRARELEAELAEDYMYHGVLHSLMGDEAEALADHAKLVELDRKLADRRVWPAIDISQSGTRREELLTKPDELQKVWILRKLLHAMDEIAAMEFLLDKLKDSKTNDEFFESMKR